MDNFVTYTNPVWPDYFADPFVLHHEGFYYAYGTGPSVEGRVFPLLRSPDLANWESLGAALEPLPGGEKHDYWAPEVAERDGRFYLYYSAAGGSDDSTQRVRVAVADHPTGPFVDSGSFVLPGEEFTIDAHPFCDPRDGSWYLFFARDFFDDRVGTALAAVRLSDDMLRTEGPITTILRASGDWQIFERNRTHYEQVWEKWHTVEGAFVVFHEDRYYCLYSGGRYENETYGVGVAVADNVLGPYVEPEHGPVVLSGVPGRVIGPGHNSVVLGPDQKTEFIVYHAWDTGMTARRMCVDPLSWTPNGPRGEGPTWTPQTLAV
jgi:GH43 family beta-xylosidase